MTNADGPHHTQVTRAVVAVALLGAGLRWVRLRRVGVEGRSMSPALEPGDRLLLVAPWRWRPGQIVALADPRTGRLLVKRISAIGPAGVEVVGDNLGASTDSRMFGPVESRLLRGRAILRYHPPSRVGWWPG